MHYVTILIPHLTITENTKDCLFNSLRKIKLNATLAVNKLTCPSLAREDRVIAAADSMSFWQGLLSWLLVREGRAARLCWLMNLTMRM
jgi:hypothetical protein